MSASYLRELRTVHADRSSASLRNQASRTKHQKTGHRMDTCLRRYGGNGSNPMTVAISPAALARTCGLLLLFSLTACTGSPAATALQPDFELPTPAGVASVSVRQPLPGMTEANSAQLVMAGMEQATRGNVIVGRDAPPYPSQRIIWHSNPSGSRDTSLLVVNVFDGANPYACEEATITDSTPTTVIRSDIAAMSKRLLADIAAEASAPNRPSGNVLWNETNLIHLSRS